MSDSLLDRSARASLIAAAALLAGTVGSRALKRPPPPPPVGAEADEVGAMVARLEERVRTRPDDAEGWRMLGWSRMQSGRFADAASAYRRVTSLTPRTADAWSSLGEALVMASGGGTLPAAAATAFAKSLTLDPKEPRARYFDGVGRDVRGDHAGAVTAWLALLRDTPRGAPWEGGLRRSLATVAQANGIDIAARVAAADAARPAPADDPSATAATPALR